jgi:hypothetical protein
MCVLCFRSVSPSRSQLTKETAFPIWYLYMYFSREAMLEHIYAVIEACASSIIDARILNSVSVMVSYIRSCVL